MVHTMESGTKFPEKNVSEASQPGIRSNLGGVRWQLCACDMILFPVSPTEATQKEKQIMRKRSLAGALAALFLMAGASAASAQEVTQAEKDRALQYLETTKKNILEATKGLSEAQWNFKPAPDRWSVAQVMEHIAAAEDFMLETAKEK